jgi:hypothetical protein
LIWKKRDKLSKYVASLNLLGLPFVGNIGAKLFVMRASMIVTLLGFFLYLFGGGITKEALLPIAHLIFMVPLPAIIWNQIAFPLQLFAAGITEGPSTSSASRFCGRKIFSTFPVQRWRSSMPARGCGF